MSNRLTIDQVDKLIRFANEVGGHKVTLMFDRNDAGQQGQQQAMAQLAKHLPVLDGWVGYHGTATEPEEFTNEEWNIQREVIANRWRLVSSS